MHRYELETIPGTSRQGIHVDGMLLAEVRDKRMLREAEFLVRTANYEIRAAYEDASTRPIVMVRKD